MCTNYENAVAPDLVYEVFSTHGITIYKRYNFAIPKDCRPTNSILTLLKQKNEYQLTNTNWGIKFNEKSPLILNSRIETIKDKSYWNNLFKNKRALLPMTGFYEWILQGKKKVRHKISLPDEEFFVVPALYYEKEGNMFTSLVTVPSNEFMEDIHHRMPAILKPRDALKIMEAEIDIAIKMCEPYRGEMKIVDAGK